MQIRIRNRLKYSSITHTASGYLRRGKSSRSTSSYRDAKLFREITLLVRLLKNGRHRVVIFACAILANRIISGLITATGNLQTWMMYVIVHNQRGSVHTFRYREVTVKFQWHAKRIFFFFFFRWRAYFDDGKNEPERWFIFTVMTLNRSVNRA